jgi:transcriptional regulator with XRE-family HTH domain
VETSGIGKRLREVRGGITQAEFADRLGVTKLTITRYEGDKTIPDGKFLLRLEELFGADPAWILLGRKDGAASIEPRTLPEEAALLADYKAASSRSKEVIRSVASVIASLEKGKG